METVSMGKTETRPWSEAVLGGRDYYLKSDPGKEATLVVSTDREGKKIVSKSQGDGIVHLEGQYVTVKDGSLYSHFLAPSAALLQDMEERPALYSPGTGTPYDPQEDYAWTDEMGMVVLY